MTATSTAVQCMEAIRGVIRGLKLTSIADASIDYCKLPWDRNKTKPGIWIHPLPESLGWSTASQQDVGYAFQVVMARVSNQDLTSDMDTFLTWREKIRRALTPAPGYRPVMSSVAALHNIRVEPQAVYWPEGFAGQYDVGALKVVCTARETGGTA